MRGCPFIGFDIACELFANTWTQNLDGHILAVGGSGPVDLCDRRRTHRFGIDIFEQFVGRFIQAGIDLRIDRFERCRRKLVLKRQQVMRRLNTDNIRPGRQCLA